MSWVLEYGERLVVPGPERVAIGEQVADLAADPAADLLDVRQRGGSVARGNTRGIITVATTAPHLARWTVKTCFAKKYVTLNLG